MLATSRLPTARLRASWSEVLLPTPHIAILPRFARPGESWSDLVDRVASIGTVGNRSDYHQLIAEGLLVPGGQILRGAGHSGAVLYNCFVTGTPDGEGPAELASRITNWTRLGAGVGVNLDTLAARERTFGRTALDVVTAIGQSQHRLWNEGATRTATMVTLSLQDPGVNSVARHLSELPYLRHLNLGVLVRDKELSDRVPALDLLSATAWRCGNPGFIFIDRVQRDHRFAETVLACNPCGEQFLAAEEGCNLASLNLAAFVRGGDFDLSAFQEAIAVAVRFLDDVIDASAFPSVETKAIAKRRRRIGLGVLGFASALHRLGLPYGGDESVALARTLATTLRETTERASEALALERGAFPDDPQQCRRNSHLLSIAPTGAISLLWQVSSGIEPVFGDIISKGDITVDFGTAGSGRPLRGDEVSSDGHLAVLGAWQAQVDGGISKTVNLPEAAKPSDIRRLLDQARAAQCKGISVFRAKSRTAAIRATDNDSVAHVETRAA